MFALRLVWKLIRKRPALALWIASKLFTLARWMWPWKARQQQIEGLARRIEVMAGEHGIKETKEALIGANALTAIILFHLHDGLQAGKDAMNVWADISGNPEVKAKIQAAADGISKVPSEVKDIQAEEGVELASVALEGVPDILKAMRGDHPFTAKDESTTPSA